MQYRKCGKLDFEVSALGFGCMRLPTSDGNRFGGNIDEAEAIGMLRHAIDNGVNYVDTAYPYHGGASEILVGKALQDGYREKVKLATKSPVWLISNEKDFDRLLEEQLNKLQTDHIDFYLLHALDKGRWNNVILKHNVLESAAKAKEDGRIRYLGFSFHDDGDTFMEILKGYEGWDFCQIQYNYMDRENQAGEKGLKAAAEKGLAVIVMEPLLGGKLATPPVSVKTLIQEYEGRKGSTPADWALQWIWNQPEVSVILSGMTTMEQVEENLKSASQSGIGILGPEDLQLVDKVAEGYRSRTAIPCTACQYCMPCPNGVDIPRNFKMYNDGYMYEDVKGARVSYDRFMKEEDRAVNCIQCRICEEECPQKIEISRWMPKVHGVLGEGRDY